MQATEGNVGYAHDVVADVVFAQFSKAIRGTLLGKWKAEGFSLASMEMAADAVQYQHPNPNVAPGLDPDLFYVGGYWAYKAQNIDKYLLPLLRETENKVLIGRGWPGLVTGECSEEQVGQYFKDAKVSPNIHEPHSTLGGYDVVERVFKSIYCGGLCISDHVEEMEMGFGLKDGTHLITAHNVEDYQCLVEEAIAIPDAYMDVREQGQKYVARYHTYFNRALNLLLELGLLIEYEDAQKKLYKWHQEIGLA